MLLPKAVSSDTGEMARVSTQAFYDISIVEVRRAPQYAVIPWLVFPVDALSSGIAVVDLDLFHSLEASGADVRMLAPYDEARLYYLIEKHPALTERALSGIGDLVWQSDRAYLLSIDGQSMERLYALRAQGRLLSPSAVSLAEAGLASLPPLASAALPPASHSQTESFWINRMVNSVKESNLLNHICSLSGKIPVNLPTGQYTLKTRYSYHPYSLKAAEYLYSQFDSMGIDVAYDCYLGIPLMCVEFIGGEGYAVGNKGIIYHTGDGGNTWEQQISGVDHDLLRSCFISQDTGWVAGMAGTLLRTVDGGSHWEGVSLGALNNIYGVEFVNASLGWICGEGGIIRKTTNGGLSWTTQTAGRVTRFQDIEFTDSLNGWAVGYIWYGGYGYLGEYDGVIFHTSDRGQNWIPQASGVNVRLFDACFADSANGWVVGSSGTVLHTTDGGATWEAQETGLDKDLFAVCFTNRFSGWIVGYGGLVLCTTDGGVHWIVRQSGVCKDLYCVDFTDDSKGWAGGASAIIRTVDGGTSWLPSAENLPNTWRNVVATLEGTTAPSQIYVVSGHYDSMSHTPMIRAPGADDNASGVSLILETARILKDYGFESTIRFVCFSAEEYLGYGSSHYACRARSRNEDIRAALNFDMIAYGTPKIYLYGNTASEWLVDYCVAVGDSFCSELPVIKMIDNGPGFSDHDAFWKKGYSALCGIELDYETNPCWHTDHDLVDYLDVGMAADVTRLAVASVASLAKLSVTPVVTAAIDIEPSTLNLESNGQHITCYVELPSEHPVDQIDVSTVLLNSSVKAEQEPSSVGDYDADGVPYLMLKFAREEVQSVIVPGESVELIVSGQVGDLLFQGRDTIRVLAGKQHSAHATDTTQVGAKVLRSDALLKNSPDLCVSGNVIRFELPLRCIVSLNVFDVTGRLVRTLINEEKAAGQYEILWDDKNGDGDLVPSGIYFYRIEAGDFIGTKKTVVLR